MCMTWTRKIGNGYYRYKSVRDKNKVRSIYEGKANMNQLNNRSVIHTNNTPITVINSNTHKYVLSRYGMNKGLYYLNPEYIKNSNQSEWIGIKIYEYTDGQYVFIDNNKTNINTLDVDYKIYDPKNVLEYQENNIKIIITPILGEYYIQGTYTDIYYQFKVLKNNTDVTDRIYDDDILTDDEVLFFESVRRNFKYKPFQIELIPHTFKVKERHH
jgi:hypothetical protein